MRDKFLMTYQIHIGFRNILAGNDKCTVPPPDSRRFHRVDMDLHYISQSLGEEKTELINKSTDNWEETMVIQEETENELFMIRKEHCTLEIGKFECFGVVVVVFIVAAAVVVVVLLLLLLFLLLVLVLLLHLLLASSYIEISLRAVPLNVASVRVINFDYRFLPALSMSQ